MKSKNKKTIFISYSWTDMKIADEIEKDLSCFQLNLLRDVRDIKYRQSISNFMEQIRNADYSILLISDSYLRSKNCMKEVLHVLKDKNFEEKILPIMLNNTNIYNSEERLKYTNYWLKEKDKLNSTISSMPPTTLVNEISELKSIENISLNINEFLSYISGIKNMTFDELKKENYKSILSLLDIDDVSHLIELLRISFLDNIDEKEVLIDQWFENNTPISEAYSLKASISSSQGNIKKARYNFNKALELDNENSFILNNYGFLLYQHNIDHDKAKECFEKAIKNMPCLTVARLNLGCLLFSKYGDYEGAKQQYEEIIKYNPTEARAYNNLTNYYKKLKGTNNKENREKICSLYEKALLLDPDYFEAHFAYGSYLSETMENHNAALDHYNEMLRIDPNSSELVSALKKRVETVIKRKSNKKIPRNDPCPCGSGKKYKKCCLNK